ncbi:hypothetical protein [Amycolatopsis regifaucium]|uniref:Phytase-like domain-containing protein n=1 Tax=Amycolatopsis regifaucium TaxID=546365 RepID=A0A154MQP3_9PSEU|nr:hypothetical protein [Amycolatopsis regifaucium]KZB86127.1 hypothetical protein AVL48_28500 [Amycolatopsis regifaucium]OKA05017.1 hypothetical protein ATP06_0228580 [Amycolatopsis regifaucium]SFH79071.1 hypothetical protein SAMN04489731_106276 [Amycolatopsis regifaucium]
MPRSSRRIRPAAVATVAATLLVLPATTAAASTTANSAWPGASAVTNADGSNVLGGNMSGLSFGGPDVLWAVKNGPGTLYRLVRNGTKWQPDTANGWSSGKALRYRNGGGDPDAEAVVATPDGVVAATERDGDNSKTSALKVLRYDVSGTAKTLTAKAEWNLTADLPKVSANDGLEAVSWIPDSALISKGFVDERTKTPYNPSSYPGHGTGLYLVGLESNGMIYAYALDQAGGKYTRVASFASGLDSIMELEYEASTGKLWAVCDDNCGGTSTTLAVGAQGKFAVTATYDRPSGMPDYNNEGFAIAGACASGSKQVVWADDGNEGGHALRAGTLSCG